MARRRIIINVYDDKLTTGQVLEMLNCIDYNSHDFEKDLVLELSEGHSVYIKKDRSLKIDISK